MFMYIHTQSHFLYSLLSIKGCFNVLSTINKASMNMWVQTFFQISFCFLQIKTQKWNCQVIRYCYVFNFLRPLHIVVVQSLSHVGFYMTSQTTSHQCSLSFTISWSLLKVMSIESVMPSNQLILCHLSPALNLAQHQGLFQRVGSLYQVVKVLELQF